MKAFVTGITGFAGSYLTQLLLAQNLEVCGTSTRAGFEGSSNGGSNAVKYFAADIRDEVKLTRALGEIRPDLIFHLAAKTSPTLSVQEPVETFDVNFGGTLTLLEAVRRLDLPCRVLLVSSAHVYGRPSAADGPLPETAPMKPRTPYAASKAASEALAYQYCQAYGIDIVRVRAFNHTGPGQRKGFVCPDLASQIAEIEQGLRPARFMVSNPDAVVDLLDVRDVVKGYYAAALKGSPGDVYNLCSGRGLPVRAIVSELVSFAGRRIHVEEDPRKQRDGAGRGLVGDSSRALSELAWRPSVPLAQTLREVLEYWRGVAGQLCSALGRQE